MTLAIEDTVFAPFNPPTDDDRDYYDLKGFYQNPEAPSPLGTLHMRQLPTGGYTLLGGLEGCCALGGCGCGCSPGMGDALAEEDTGSKAWIPLTIIVGLWALLNYGGDIADYYARD